MDIAFAVFDDFRALVIIQNRSENLKTDLRVFPNRERLDIKAFFARAQGNHAVGFGATFFQWDHFRAVHNCRTRLS